MGFSLTLANNNNRICLMGLGQKAFLFFDAHLEGELAV